MMDAAATQQRRDPHAAPRDLCHASSPVPTTVTVKAARRRALLALARTHRIAIVEVAREDLLLDGRMVERQDDGVVREHVGQAAQPSRVGRRSRAEGDNAARSEHSKTGGRLRDCAGRERIFGRSEVTLSGTILGTTLAP